MSSPSKKKAKASPLLIPGGDQNLEDWMSEQETTLKKAEKVGSQFFPFFSLSPRLRQKEKKKSKKDGELKKGVVCWTHLGLTKRARRKERDEEAISRQGREEGEEGEEEEQGEEARRVRRRGRGEEKAQEEKGCQKGRQEGEEGEEKIQDGWRRQDDDRCFHCCSHARRRDARTARSIRLSESRGHRDGRWHSSVSDGVGGL